MADTIQSLVDRFLNDEKPATNLLDESTVLAQAIAAVNFYSGYGALATHLAIPIADPPPDLPAPYPAITSATEITPSEWAVIRPLFMLYVELESATQLEASRGMGIDVFGRSVSEIKQDIAMRENDVMPNRAFSQVITTI
jgi:hypothetical protein